MKRAVFLAWRAQRGITLVEILVALAIFAIVAVGTLGAVGVANVGGLLEGFPVAFATNRTAKDITAATTYVQTLQEYVAEKGVGGVSLPVIYCAPFPACITGGEVALPGDYPLPSSEGLEQPYQLDWTKVVVVIEKWGWNGAQYVVDPGCGDCLIRVSSTLTWQLRPNEFRTVMVERFLKP